MLVHKNTEPTEINFSKLESRIRAINNSNSKSCHRIQKMLQDLIFQKKPTLIMATGGSKVISYYLQMILESFQILCEVIEPRDYFYKKNIECFSNLVVISASGRTNGIESALNHFKGKKYLLCEKERNQNCENISWGSESYEREKSFISLATSLGPITLLLESITFLNKEIDSNKINQINDKITWLIQKSKERINEITKNFLDTSLIQIMSGYDTLASSRVLESNLTEVGLSAPVIHDKGSFCHGRSNLLFQYPNSYMLYLTHQLKEIDLLLIRTIQDEYPNFILFSTEDLKENKFWKEYYLMLQMYFLSKKIAEDKNMDLTMPEYNPNLVRKIYNFKGEM